MLAVTVSEIPSAENETVRAGTPTVMFGLRSELLEYTLHRKQQAEAGVLWGWCPARSLCTEEASAGTCLGLSDIRKSWSHCQPAGTAHREAGLCVTRDSPSHMRCRQTVLPTGQRWGGPGAAETQQCTRGQSSSQKGSLGQSTRPRDLVRFKFSGSTASEPPRGGSNKPPRRFGCHSSARTSL